MNRERILFVGVLAILVLWFFVIREPAQPRRKAMPVEIEPTILPVRSWQLTQMTLPEFRKEGDEPFVRGTNERPHPRPELALTEERNLPNIWPPTSRSLSLMRLGKLRREGAPPVADEATIVLPETEAPGLAPVAGPLEDRVDLWSSFNRETRGKVTGLIVNGKRELEPDQLPPVGPLPRYYRLLLWLEQDRDRARQEGVTEVQVKFGLGGTVKQGFPDEIDDFKIALEGKQRGWFIGAKAWNSLPAKGYERRLSVGNRLLEQGVNSGDKAILAWSVYILGEARKLVPPAVQKAQRGILLSMLEAARKLNRQEEVLALGFEHLSRYPDEELVLEYIGNILASRSFQLHELALDFYARARTSKAAQKRRAALLIDLGRFDEARVLLEDGSCGSGAEVDLLLARAALAQADFATAISRAQMHVTGEDAAEAYQILGGAAYAQGNAVEAQEAFLNAGNADPERSTAYSDLGLALAVQGKAADAVLCFKKAASLDFENTVIPRIGEAYLKLNGGDLDAARTILEELAKDNPRDLLVRYFQSYVLERSGELEAAAAGYRSVLDDNHRYRIAIARLGLVQSRRAASGEDPGLQRPAVAHLRKAVDLNPDEPVLPYILGRFEMDQGINLKEADSLLERSQQSDPPAQDPSLPLWSRAARAALAYRSYANDELAVKSMFNRVIDEVRDQVVATGEADVQRAMDNHPVYKYAKNCIDVISENQSKVDITWRFTSSPRDWDKVAKLPMSIGFVRDRGAHFNGKVDFQGKARTFHTILEFCALRYATKKLTGSDFHELEIEGEIPTGTPVDVGVGIVGPSTSRRRGPAGIQIRRKARKARPEVRLDGGESELFKRDKARNFLEMTQVAWPAGKFKVLIRVEDREKGRISLHLNDTDVFRTQIGQESERCVVFGSGRRSRQVQIYIWVEGNDGDPFKDIYITSVRLTKAGS